MKFPCLLLSSLFIRFSIVFILLSSTEFLFLLFEKEKCLSHTQYIVYYFAVHDFERESTLSEYILVMRTDLNFLFLECK